MPLHSRETQTKCFLGLAQRAGKPIGLFQKTQDEVVFGAFTHTIVGNQRRTSSVHRNKRGWERHKNYRDEFNFEDFRRPWAASCLIAQQRAYFRGELITPAKNVHHFLLFVLTCFLLC